MAPGEGGTWREVIGETCGMHTRTHARTHARTHNMLHVPHIHSKYVHVSCGMLHVTRTWFAMFMSTHRYIVFVQLRVDCFTQRFNTTHVHPFWVQMKLFCFLLCKTLRFLQLRVECFKQRFNTQHCQPFRIQMKLLCFRLCQAFMFVQLRVNYFAHISIQTHFNKLGLKCKWFVVAR